MPLLPGKRNIGQNIKTEEAAGKPRAQAVAIALDVARRAGAEIPKPKGGNPVAKKQKEKEPFPEMMAELKNPALEKAEPKSKQKEEMPGRGHNGPVKKQGGFQGY